MARRPFQLSRQSRPNRNWAGTVPAAYAAVPANNKLLLATFVLSSEGIDETILRVVGTVSVISDQVAATEDQIGAIGMCLATDTAVAVGIGSLPDPVTDVGDDIWFMYQSFAQRFVVADATGLNPNSAQNYLVNSRAKRIVSSGMTICIIAANATAAQGFNIAFPMRLLAQVRGTR